MCIPTASIFQPGVQTLKEVFKSVSHLLLDFCQPTDIERIATIFHFCNVKPQEGTLKYLKKASKYSDQELIWNSWSPLQVKSPLDTL